MMTDVSLCLLYIYIYTHSTHTCITGDCYDVNGFTSSVLACLYFALRKVQCLTRYREMCKNSGNYTQTQGATFYSVFSKWNPVAPIPYHHCTITVHLVGKSQQNATGHSDMNARCNAFVIFHQTVIWNIRVMRNRIIKTNQQQLLVKLLPSFIRNKRSVTVTLVLHIS